MSLTIHVALFQDRHLVPAFVKDYIYENRQGGWDMLDIWEFQRVALHKFSQWKSRGITNVTVYLSGLTSAVISALNAAHSIGLSVKLMHYSFIIDRWLPQPLEFMPACTPLSSIERELWDEDRREKSAMTTSEYKEFCAYIKAYRDAIDKFKDTVVSWETAREFICDQLVQRPNTTYLNIIRPYICPEYDTDEKGVSLNVKLRNAIHAARKSGTSTSPKGGYCAKPPVKKYKGRRR